MATGEASPAPPLLMAARFADGPTSRRIFGSIGSGSPLREFGLDYRVAPTGFKFTLVFISKSAHGHRVIIHERPDLAGDGTSASLMQGQNPLLADFVENLGTEPKQHSGPIQMEKVLLSHGLKIAAAVGLHRR